MFSNIFKAFIELVTTVICFMFRFFGHEACEILVPQPGIEPPPPVWEGEVSTTGQPGKPQMYSIWKFSERRGYQTTWPASWEIGM